MTINDIYKEKRKAKNNYEIPILARVNPSHEGELTEEAKVMPTLTSFKDGKLSNIFGLNVIFDTTVPEGIIKIEYEEAKG